MWGAESGERCARAKKHPPFSAPRSPVSSSLRWHLLVLLSALAFSTPAVQAQLISPGKLAQAHQDLDGIRNCTACHSLGNKGIDNTLCLDCHTPLKTRLYAGRGFHASVAEQNCADCHKEHFGAAFQLVRFDTTRFDHQETGFRLAGAHEQVACRTCHRPAYIADAEVRAFKGRNGALSQTFLGLGTRCLSCHESESPHTGQFVGEDCATCHAEDRWEEAERFDHDDARFKLIGRHRQVECGDCHPQAAAPDGHTFTRYEDLDFANCSSCHDDAHGGVFGANCANCHDPASWQQIRNFDEDRFDHAATGFDLVGQHARLDCAACHTRPARRDTAIQLAFLRGTERHTYPQIQVDDCQSCHVDTHEQVFEETDGGANCANCHTEDAWTPVTYDLDRHNRETRFVLTGAHLATPCIACHHTEEESATFRFTDLECQTCHASDNPHGTQFDDPAGVTKCTECHTTDGWTLGETFDHDQTGFPLTGAHVDVVCAACHRPPSENRAMYRDLATDCLSCHSDDDPHQDQFDGQTCETCHDTEAFETASARFDHNQTRFPLDGAHREVVCGQCHRQETAPGGDRFIRYRPLGLACKDCHSDG